MSVWRVDSPFKCLYGESTVPESVCMESRQSLKVSVWKVDSPFNSLYGELTVPLIVCMESRQPLKVSVWRVDSPFKCLCAGKKQKKNIVKDEKFYSE